MNKLSRLFIPLLMLLPLLGVPCGAQHAETSREEVSFVHPTLRNKEEDPSDLRTTEVLVDHLSLNSKPVVCNSVYSDEIFFSPSTAYHHVLARQSLGMAAAAFYYDVGMEFTDSNVEQEESPVSERGSLKQYLDANGFGTVRVDDYFKETSIYTIGSVIASKTIRSNGKTASLVAVAIRGGNYVNEWQSNLTLNVALRHEGFNNAATLVTDRVLSFISTMYLPHEIKVWVTGFSRAGAVANIVAANLNASNVLNKNNVYAYTFAAPQSAWTYSDEYVQMLREENNNIFNIVGPSDLVPQFVPNEWAYYRYGIDRRLPGWEYNSDFPAKYKRIQDTLEKMGAKTYYSTGLNLRIRLLFGLLEEISPDDVFFADFLQPLFVGIMRDKTMAGRAALLREALLNIQQGSPDSLPEMNSLIEYLVNMVPPLITGRSYMEGEFSSAGSGLELLFHEHFDELYFYWMHLFEEDELFADSEGFAHILVDDVPTLIIRDSGVNVEIGRFKAGTMTYSAYAKQRNIDLNVQTFGGKKMLLLPYDRAYAVSYQLDEGVSADIKIVPYGVSFVSSLELYDYSLNATSPREGKLLVISNNSAKFYAERTYIGASDFARILSIDKGPLSFYAVIYLISFCVALLLGLLTLIISFISHQLTGARMYPGYIALGAFSFGCLLSGFFSYWVLASLNFLAPLFFGLSALSLVGAYALLQRRRIFKNPLRTALPAFTLLGIGFTLSVVHWPTALCFLIAGVGYLCFLALMKRRLEAGQWLGFVLFALAIICVCLMAVQPITLNVVLFVILCVLSLLYLFAAFVGDDFKRIGSLLLFGMVMLLTMNPFSADSFLASLVFSVAFFVAFLYLCTFYEATDLAVSVDGPQGDASTNEPTVTNEA